MTVRIGVVDDHHAVALGVAAALAGADGLTVAGSAADVGAWIAAGLEADVVVLDLSLGDDSDPADNVRRLRDRGHAVVVLTGGDDPHAIRRAARAGVHAVVLKSAPMAGLLAAVRAAASGEAAPSTPWAAALDGDPNLGSAGLSEREAEVLALYAAGEKTGRVARALGISEHTVIEHVRTIRQKYARVGRPAPTKVDLYRRAVEDGYLPQPRRGRG